MDGPRRRHSGRCHQQGKHHGNGGPQRYSVQTHRKNLLRLPLSAPIGVLPGAPMPTASRRPAHRARRISADRRSREDTPPHCHTTAPPRGHAGTTAIRRPADRSDAWPLCPHGTSRPPGRTPRPPPIESMRDVRAHLTEIAQREDVKGERPTHGEGVPHHLPPRGSGRAPQSPAPCRPRHSDQGDRAGDRPSGVPHHRPVPPARPPPPESLLTTGQNTPGPHRSPRRTRKNKNGAPKALYRQNRHPHGTAEALIWTRNVRYLSSRTAHRNDRPHEEYRSPLLRPP